MFHKNQVQYIFISKQKIHYLKCVIKSDIIQNQGFIKAVSSQIYGIYFVFKGFASIKTLEDCCFKRHVVCTSNLNTSRAKKKKEA